MHSDQMRKDVISESIIQAFNDFVANYVILQLPLV